MPRSVALLWLLRFVTSWLRDFHRPSQPVTCRSLWTERSASWWHAVSSLKCYGFWWLLVELVPEGPHCARLATPSQLCPRGFLPLWFHCPGNCKLCKCVHAAVFKQRGNMERMLFLRLASICHVLLISDSSATLWLDLAIGIVTEPPPKLILRPLSWCQSSPRRHFDYGRWQLIEELSNWRATMDRLGNCSINIDIDLNSVPQPPLLEVQGQQPHQP